MPRRYLSALIVFFAACITHVSGQVATGMPPFASLGGGPADTINLANLNIHLTIPLVHKAGRGMPFTYDLSYDSSIWTPSGGSWQATINYGWRGVTEITTGYISYSSVSSICPGTGVHDGRLTFRYFGFVYHDTFGTQHAFAGQAIDATDCPTDNSRDLNSTATDGSGFRLFFPGGGSANPQSLTSASGQVTIPPSGGGTTGAAHVTDANGNQISVDGSGISATH
ncbi:MAG TPA: hypothetical protein VFA74_07820 [Terriglobales bacterium]|nr:hypothetical protein [Terriglobales bacterium]